MQELTFADTPGNSLWRCEAGAKLAGAPFVCLNTLVGGLAAYGLAGLRAESWAVAQFALMLVLQSLVAIQTMVLSVYITPNQAR